MEVIIKDNKVIKTEPKTIYSDLYKKVENNQKHKTDFIIKQ